jgi:hypothetical protein
MKRLVYLLIIFTTLLATALVATRSVLASPQRSQPKGTSVLSGVVLGPNDRPAAHAAVSYQSSSGSFPHVVHTDAHGRFTIAKLAADNYDVRASANGIFSDWEKNVTLHSGQSRNITLQLIYAKKMPKSGSATSASTNTSANNIR